MQETAPMGVLKFPESDVIQITSEHNKKTKNKYKDERNKKNKDINTIVEDFWKESQEHKNKEIQRSSKFYLGEGNTDEEIKKQKSKKMRKKLKDIEEDIEYATLTAQDANDLLLPSNRGYIKDDTAKDTTVTYKQKDILDELEYGVLTKHFTLDLPTFGPYKINYTRNGSHVQLGGRKGHIGQFKWQDKSLLTEFYVKETIRDIKILHDETMFAVAQKEYIYMYDERGTEQHVMRNIIEPTVLEYQPYHYILSSSNKRGILNYLDTSIGSVVCEHNTKLGPCYTMVQNIQNGVLHLGHQNGTVSLWTPNMSTPVAKVLCHPSPILNVQISNNGIYMVTSGLDSYVNIWDLRTYKKLHTYNPIRPATTLAISQTNQLCIGSGTHLQIWDKGIEIRQDKPYMSENFNKDSIYSCTFCPYEDVLGVGTNKLFTSLIIPGSGEPNFDTFVDNPYQTNKQRREANVHRLLEKLQPDMITLDKKLFTIFDKHSQNEFIIQRKKQLLEEQLPVVHLERKKMKGKSKPTKRLARKKLRKETMMALNKKELIKQRDSTKPSITKANGPSTNHSFDLHLKRFKS